MKIPYRHTFFKLKLNLSLVILSIICFCEKSVIAQQNPVDSLKNKIKKTSSLKEKVLLYDALAVQYWTIDLDSAKSIGERMIKLSEEANFEQGVSKAYVKIGMAHLYASEKEKAIDFANKVIKLNNDPRSTATAYNLIGGNYFYEYDFYKAIEIYRKTYDIASKAGFKRIQASASINIGMIYEELEDFEKAYTYYNRGIEFAKVAEDGTLLKTQGYYNLGNAYLLAERYDEAIRVLNESIKINKSLENYNLLTYSYGALCMAYLEKGELDKSKTNCELAELYLAKSTQGFYLVGSINIILARLYQELEEYDVAISYGTKAFDVSLSANNPENIVDSSKLLYTLFREKNNYEKMNAYLDYYMSYSDTIDQIGVKMKINNHVKELEMRNIELQKKEEISKAKQKSRYSIFGVILGSILVTAAFLFFRNRKLSKLNKEKDDFLSSVSHEMKTPLNVILGFTKLLDKKVVNELEAEYVEEIGKASKDLLGQVKGILKKSSKETEGDSELIN